MKRVIGWTLAIGLLIGAIYMLTDRSRIWKPEQIERALVNGQSVPPSRFPELVQDLRKEPETKCDGFVELWLKGGKQVTLWMDGHLAEKYKGCGR
jgi:hypothetical protein